MNTDQKPTFVIVMGVSGSGKTTVGALLAARMDCSFFDADDYHSPENIQKMAGGVPLTDADRAGWLDALAKLIRAQLAAGQCGVLACSALKAQYRHVLNVDSQKVRFVYLQGRYAEIENRLQNRDAHFMPPELLRSQFEALEEPPDALTLDAHQPPQKLVEVIMDEIRTPPVYDLGMIGMGVMGRSLALNFERNGFRVIGYDLAPRLPEGFNVRVTPSLDALVGALSLPRVILMMVPAGAPVDAAIASIKPYLSAGDIIVDGGNSYFEDTRRRIKLLEADGIHFVGMGVSGGESGALWGPSLMPGGAAAAWERIQPIFTAIAARADDGTPCVDWVGPDGAGHYTKMVHNGIEYGDMQLIAEIYDLLHRGAGISNTELADVFAQWNQGVLRSYLVEITADILTQVDAITGGTLVDYIVDEAEQKGTGKWTSQNAFDIGAPIPTINAAVESRMLSALKAERVEAAKRLGSAGVYHGDRARLLAAAENALYASKITSYAQGLSLLRSASRSYGWDLEIARIVRLWRAGCIIRAAMLNDIANAFDGNPSLANLLVDDRFAEAVLQRQHDWRLVVQAGVETGIPMLATGASLAYFDAYRSERLPANLTQAQRDYFGAHTYRRIDMDGSFHTRWDEE